MLRFLLVLSLLLTMLSDVVAAQEIDPVRFTPLAIGDSWEYILTHQDWPHGGEPGPNVVLGYLTTEVARDTVIDETTYRVLVRREYDAALTLTASESCFVRVLADGSVDFPAIGGACDELDALDKQYSLPLPFCDVTGSMQVPGMVTVGGIEYQVPATAVCLTAGGMGSGWRLHYAADLGLHRWQSERLPHHPPLIGFVLNYRLAYATVGDDVYGTSPTGVDPQPPLGTALALSPPFPNPTTGEVRFTVSGAEPGDLVVHVFDPAGRLIRSQQVLLYMAEGRVTLDLAGLASGAYLVRVTDLAGRSGGRSVLKW